MRRNIRVDRQKEIDIFERILTEETKDRILLISAPSGTGKSELLREFSLRCPKTTYSATVDFKNQEVTFAELIFRICYSLGTGLFKTLSNTLHNYNSPSSVHIHKNIMFGQNTINVTLNVLDDETRNFRQASLTEAFFTDLGSIGPVVLVFDTFNDCTNPIVKAWMAGDFLYRIRHTPNVVVVIAGQNVPEPTLEWESICYPHTLHPIECKYWHEYAEKIGAVLPSLHYIDAFYECFQGKPSDMAKILARYIPQEIL